MLGFFHAACAEQNLSGAFNIQNQACTWSPVLPKDRMVSLGQPCHAAAGTVPCHPWGSQGSSWAGAVQPCLGELLGCPRGRETRQKQSLPWLRRELGCCWESCLCTVTSPASWPQSISPLPQGLLWERPAPGLGGTRGCPWLLMVPTISPPHYTWLSVLLWLEGTGFVKDVSSHIV